jgi:hypothetical protein
MKPILELFDIYLPVKPEYIMRSNRPLVKIQQYNCNIVLEALDKYGDVIEIYAENKDTSLTIMQEAGKRSAFGLWIKLKLVKNMDPLELRKFFLNITQVIPFTYASCHFDKNRKDLNNNVYEKISERTFFTSGLFWLNFFGPEEEANQGGKALENNPYATEIKRFDNGLFIQVGESPFDCYTDAGREQLINATKAMPPATGW